MCQKNNEASSWKYLVVFDNWKKKKSYKNWTLRLRFGTLARKLINSFHSVAEKHRLVNSTKYFFLQACLEISHFSYITSRENHSYQSGENHSIGLINLNQNYNIKIKDNFACIKDWNLQKIGWGLSMPLFQRKNISTTNINDCLFSS